MTKALDILHREHRAMAAVLHCLSHVVTEVRQETLAPEFDLFKTILTYMRDFPDRFHHPKEDKYLFPAVRKRSPKVAGVIDELESQHESGETMLAKLDRDLANWEATPTDKEKAKTFLDAADDYVEFQRKHAAQEERIVMPEARKSLSDADWEPINAALTDNEDPIFGEHPALHYQKLFSQIVQLAPLPWGTAERRTPEPPTDDQGNIDDTIEKWNQAQRQAVLRLHWI